MVLCDDGFEVHGILRDGESATVTVPYNSKVDGLEYQHDSIVRDACLPMDCDTLVLSIILVDGDECEGYSKMARLICKSKEDADRVLAKLSKNRTDGRPLTIDATTPSVIIIPLNKESACGIEVTSYPNVSEKHWTSSRDFELPPAFESDSFKILARAADRVKSKQYAFIEGNVNVSIKDSSNSKH